MNKIKQRLQSMIDLRSAQWLDRQVVRLGKDSTQVIETGKPGVLWARLSNGRPIKVHVSSANVPSRFDLHLLVGRQKSQPAIWRVIYTLEDYDDPAGEGEVTYHHKQHEEEGGDRLNLSWKQIVARSVRVKNAAGFIVRVFGDPDLTPNGWSLIPTQDIDLSSYVPTTGAVFVAIESDDDGALSIHAGTAFAAPGIGNVGKYPVPASGKYTRALVLLFEGQTALLDEHIRIPKPPSFNPSAISGGSHVHALDDLDDVNAPAPTDGQVLTYDFYAGEWFAADPTGGGGGITDAPSDGNLYGRKDAGWEIVHERVSLHTDAPTVDDDTSLGFEVGDFWLDTALDRLYSCQDNTDGAAVWLRIVNASELAASLDTLTVIYAPISLSSIVSTGWAPVTETWTRTGNHVFTVSGDLTTKYRKGRKVRYDDGSGNEYGTIRASSHSAGTTTVELMVNSNFSMGSNPSTRYLSLNDKPDGFPDLFDFAIANPTGSGSGGPMTVAVTATGYARFRESAGRIAIETQFTVTTSGTASIQINVDLPVAGLDTNSYPLTLTYVDGAGSGVVGVGGANGNTGKLLARKQDNSVWGIGTGRIIQLNGEYPY